MSAKFMIMPLAAVGLFAPAWAQDGEQKASPLTIELTQAKEPSSKAWEDPALISFEIDPKGPDRWNIAANLQAKYAIPTDPTDVVHRRARSVGGYFRWDKDTKAGNQKDALEVGLAFDVDYKLSTLLNLTEFDANLSNEELAQLADERAKTKWDFSHKFTLAYARQVQFPDLDKAPCDTSPALPQCSKQYSESIRAGYVTAPFYVPLEGYLAKGLAYSLAPKLGVDYDEILNSPLDTDTGLAKSGGYLSGVAGISALVAPGFTNPGWELKASFQTRAKVFASASRNPGIEGSAESFEASATYYFIRPQSTAKKGWRAGFGVTYTIGHDPLVSDKSEERILFSVNLGRY